MVRAYCNRCHKYVETTTHSHNGNLKNKQQLYESQKTTYKRFYNLIFKRHYFGLTSPFRVLPDFFVIGAGRTGTTSLFHYLSQHPSIVKSAYDELGYFDVNFHLGLNWYRSLFPSIITKFISLQKTKAFLTYDVTPSYVRRPWTAERIHNIFPNSKLIVVLRNPADRCYSHYYQSTKYGDERTFEQLIKQEMNEIHEWKNGEKDNHYFATKVENSILARCFYAEQLTKWFDVFSKDQIMIIKSEELASNTKNIMNAVFKFLKISGFEIPNAKKVNVSQYNKMEPKSRKLLIDFFRPYNEELYKLIGRDFGWNDDE